MIKTPYQKQDADGFVVHARKPKKHNRKPRPPAVPLALAPGDDIAFSPLELAIYRMLKHDFPRGKTAEQLKVGYNHNKVDVREDCCLQDVWDALDNEEALGKYVYRIEGRFWTLRTQ